MMSIELSGQTPPPRRDKGTPPRRPTPCTGLFGWRKDAGPPPRPKGKDDPQR